MSENNSLNKTSIITDSKEEGMIDFIDPKDKLKKINRGGLCEYSAWPEGVVYKGADYQMKKEIPKVVGIYEEPPHKLFSRLFSRLLFGGSGHF